MGVLSNKITREELKPGDHIYSWRQAYIYAHHGIYVDDGMVIHFTRGKGQEAVTGTVLDDLLVSSSPQRNTNIPCPKCGDQSRLGGGVMTSCLDCFLFGGELYIFEYGVSRAFFLAKARGGTCTLASSDPPEDVLHRAFFLLENGFGGYDVFKNNCEDFAIYCKTGLLVFSSSGVGGSGQAASYIATAKSVVSASLDFLTSSFSGLAVVRNCIYCVGKYCDSRLYSDIGMRGDVSKVPVEKLVGQLGLDEPAKTTGMAEKLVGQPDLVELAKTTGMVLVEKLVGQPGLVELAKTTRMVLAEKLVGKLSLDEPASYVASAKTMVSTSLRFLTTSFSGLAVVRNGMSCVGKYCVNRLDSNIGLRCDVSKVPVEKLVGQSSLVETVKTTGMVPVEKLVSQPSLDEPTSYVNTAKTVVSTSLHFLTTSFSGLAVVRNGMSCVGKYCVSRLDSSIGVRRDVSKVSVEKLVGQPGLDELAKTTGTVPMEKFVGQPGLDELAKTTGMVSVEKLVGQPSLDEPASYVATAKTMVSTSLRSLTTSFSGLAVVRNGMSCVCKYCVSRLDSSIGVRRDVSKVPVEKLVGQPSLDEPAKTTKMTKEKED